MTDPLPLILAGTLGAGAMLVLTPPALPVACEPVELVRFVSSPPEIHIVSETTYGRSAKDWLQQFEHDEPVVATENEPRNRHRWRRHGRS